jgi:hypothetical protein
VPQAYPPPPSPAYSYPPPPQAYPTRLPVQAYAPPPAQKKSFPCLPVAAGVGVLLMGCCVLVAAAGYFGYLGSAWPGPTSANRSTILGPSSTQPAGEIIPLSEPTMPDVYAATRSQPEAALTQASAAATEAPALTIAPASTNTLDFAGVVITYDTALASDIQPQMVEATGGPSPAPNCRLYTLQGYPLTGSHHDPQIFVFPVQAYADLDPQFQNTLHLLKGMIDGNMIYNLPEPLPFFPAWPAGEQFQAGLKYLEFQSGRGMRYLTQYGQESYPINNQDMFYTFQGLSEDGQWLVSAVLPVSNPVLPDPATVSQDQAFYDTYREYAQKTAGLLESQPDDSFTPSLAQLDIFVQSIFLK